MQSNQDAVVYTNAQVITVDREFTVSDGFRVADGRFVAVGSSGAGRGPGGATVVDLGGRTVLPGFVDAHAHLATRAFAKLPAVDVSDATSVRDVCRRVARHIEHEPTGGLLVTSAIGPGPDFFHLPDRLAERRWPTREDLDRVSGARPVVIPTPHNWPHPAVLNTAALRLLELWDEAAVPPGIIVDRGADGAPTGLVHGINNYNETRVSRQLAELAPTPADERVVAALRAVIDESVAAGVTAAYEPHLNKLVPQFRRLSGAGELAIRVGGTYEIPVRSSLDAIRGWLDEHSDAAGPGTGDARMRVRGFTASLDGAIQFGKAFMHDEYRDPYGATSNGASALDVDELVEIGRWVAGTGSRFHVLGAGAAAVDIVVRALERLHDEVDLRGRDWMVLHMQHPSREHVASLAAMGIRAQSYTSVDFSKGAAVYRDRLDGEEWRSVVPIRWWLDAGVQIAQGSDGAHYEPLFHVWDALVRRDGRTGESLMTAAKDVTREEAIRMCTINGAHVMQLADEIGSIETGKAADFVVLDGDPLSCAVDDIAALPVHATVIDGTVVSGELG